MTKKEMLGFLDKFRMDIEKGKISTLVAQENYPVNQVWDPKTQKYTFNRDGCVHTADIHLVYKGKKVK